MKAEDTVIEDILEAIKYKDGEVGLSKFRRLALAQAEISFKAGIKEVVDWIKARGGLQTNFQGTDDDGYPVTQLSQIEEVALLDDGIPRIYVYYIEPNVWQAKLKEWGIK